MAPAEQRWHAEHYRRWAPYVPALGRELIELLATLRERGKAILLATESPFQARRLADRLSILREGRQVLSLKRDELAYHDLDALYLGRLPDWVAGAAR